MKKAVFVMIPLAILIVGYFWYVRGVDLWPKPQVVSQKWQSQKPFEVERTEVGVGTLKDKIYVVGGFDGLGQASKSVEIYDPNSNSWVKGPELPEGLHHVGVTTSDNSLFIIGGFKGSSFNPVSSLYVLMQNTEKWERKKDLLEKVGALSAVFYNNKIYLFGGQTREGLLTTSYEYDVEKDSWTAINSLPTPRDHLAASLIGDKIYIVGGRKADMNKNLDILDIYDPQTNSFSKGKNLPTARGGIASATLNGKLYVFGGEGTSGTFKSNESYDPATDLWTKEEEMPAGRHGLGAASVGGKIYVLGGGKRPGLSVSGLNEVFALDKK